MAPEAANPRRAGLFTNENQGNRLCEEEIWISADPCSVAAGRVENQPQAGLQTVQAGRLEPEETIKPKENQC